jgi:hypothetical protein
LNDVFCEGLDICLMVYIFVIGIETESIFGYLMNLGIGEPFEKPIAGEQ